jgi:hypothetical protein
MTAKSPWVALGCCVSNYRVFSGMRPTQPGAHTVNYPEKVREGLDKVANTALLLCCAACFDERWLAPSRHPFGRVG